MQKIYLDQLKNLDNEVLKDKLVLFLSKNYITVTELIAEKSLTITGNIFNNIGCMYWTNTQPLSQNYHDAGKLFEQAHDKRNSYGSYNSVLYHFNINFLPSLQDKKIDLGSVIKHAETCVRYFTIAKERGYGKRSVDKYFIKIGKKFFDITEYQQADAILKISSKALIKHIGEH